VVVKKVEPLPKPVVAKPKPPPKPPPTKEELEQRAKRLADKKADSKVHAAWGIWDDDD
jgi:hypothetical protein